MSSSLAAIGAGSGINFSDVYDKLKKAEESASLSRPNKELEKNSVQQKDLTSLITHVNTFKGSINSLKDGSLFLKRNVDVAGVGDSGASVGVSISSGVNKANFSLNVLELAKKDSYQSDVFKTKTSTIFNSEDMYIKDPSNPSNDRAFQNGSFTITINDKHFVINVDANDTLETLVDKMSSTKSQESLLESGDDKKDDDLLSNYIDIKALKVDSNDNYRLVISSKETGAKNKITFDTNGDNVNDLKFSQNILNKLGFGANTSLGSELKIKKAEDINSIQKQMDDMIANAISNGQTEDDVKNSADYQDLLTKLEMNKAQFDDFSKKNSNQIVEDYIKSSKNEMTKILDSHGIDSTLSHDKIMDKLNQIDPKEASKYESLFNTTSELEKKFNDLQNFKDEEHHISVGRDAEIEYDGIKLFRSTNEVDDIITGANIKLLKKGVSNVNITSDTSDLKEALNDFVKNYNTLIANINAATAYNDETKMAGTFQGTNEVTRIKSELASLINSVDVNSKYSLSGLGFELSRDGVLKFDSSKFEAAYSKDPTGVEKYFSGNTIYTPFEYSGKEVDPSKANTILAKGDLKINGKDIVFSDEDRKILESNNDPKKLLEILKKTIDEAKIDGLMVILDSSKNTISFKTDGRNGFEIEGSEDKIKALGLEKKSVEVTKTEEQGIFTKLRDTIDGYVGKSGSLTKFSEQLSQDAKKLKDDKEKIQKELDKKYDNMATRFNLYDGMISKMKQQESVIASMINAQFANK